MKKRLFTLSIEEQRAAIRERLDRCRRKQNPTCHLLVADDDYDALLTPTIQAYEIQHGIKLVPMRDIRAHRMYGRCKNAPASVSAA
jgi:hypothetical protein